MLKVTPPSRPSASRSGVGFALAAYLAWGVFPLYFRALTGVPPVEILAHRVVWSALFLAALVAARREGARYRQAFRSARSIGIYAVSTALITSNWLVYIWAATSGRVLEASLGYFITPLVSVLLGMALLGERLRPRQTVAVALAAAGVLVLVVRAAVVPWLALALAASFGGYGLVRKKAALDPVVGLLVETSLVAPFGAVIIIWGAVTGAGHLGSEPLVTALLLLSGVVTALPLIWFAHGVRRLPLSTMGLMQYVSPTLQFLCAVMLFHEPFTRTHAAAFACIWTALALYTWDALAARHHAAEAVRAKQERRDSA